MNKRIIYILVGALTFFLVIFLVVSNYKNIADFQKNEQPSTSVPEALPDESENSEKNIQIVEEKIKNASISPVSQKAVEEGIESIELKNEYDKKIPLSDFKKATNVSVVGKLSDYLDNNDYDVFYCPGDKNGKDFAVYFGYNENKAYIELYPNTLAWMKDWEKTILSDLHEILFPGVVFSEEELNQALQFHDGRHRYANIKLPNGKGSSINYHVSGGGVIISSSPSCMDEMIEIYEPLEP